MKTILYFILFIMVTEEKKSLLHKLALFQLSCCEVIIITSSILYHANHIKNTYNETHLKKTIKSLG